MCVVCVLLLWLSCVCLQTSHLQWLFACCRQSLVPGLLGQSRAALGLSWGNQVLAKDVVTLNYRLLPLYCPLRNLGGQGLLPDLMSAPTPMLGLQLDWSMCVIIFPLPKAEVPWLWSGAGPWSGCMCTVRLVQIYRVCSCQGLVGAAEEGGCPQKNSGVECLVLARFMQISYRKGSGPKA